MNKKIIIAGLVIGILAVIIWKLTKQSQQDLQYVENTTEGFSGAFDPSVRSVLQGIGPVSIQENYCPSCQ